MSAKGLKPETVWLWFQAGSFCFLLLSLPFLAEVAEGFAVALP